MKRFPLFLIWCLIGMLCSACVRNLISSVPTESSESIEAVCENNTLEDFYFLDEGISYDEVVNILGTHDSRWGGRGGYVYDLCDGRRVILFFLEGLGLEEALVQDIPNMQYEILIPEPRNNLTLDEFDFLEFGMSIYFIENKVGSSSFIYYHDDLEALYHLSDGSEIHIVYISGELVEAYLYLPEEDITESLITPPE